MGPGHKGSHKRISRHFESSRYADCRREKRQERGERCNNFGVGVQQQLSIFGTSQKIQLRNEKTSKQSPPYLNEAGGELSAKSGGKMMTGHQSGSRIGRRRLHCVQGVNSVLKKGCGGLFSWERALAANHRGSQETTPEPVHNAKVSLGSKRGGPTGWRIGV